MKKLIISALFAMGVMGAYAQTAEAPQAEVPLTKSGYKFLPEAGDYALGISANPFLNYLGNAFNGNMGNNFVNNGFGNANNSFGDAVIYGKYFLSADQAVRAKLVINTGQDIYKQTVQDDYAESQPGYNYQTVVDVVKDGRTAVGLNVGYEFRRGYRRLQGFYGAELGVGYSTGGTTSYEYANPITADNQSPSHATFDQNFQTTGVNPQGTVAERDIEVNRGNRFDVMLGGFAGVEYFIFPKLSIGGEIGLQFSAYTVGQTETTTETWNANLGQVLESSVREKRDKASGLRFQTMPQGNLFMMFYF